jgi:type IV pilus assembly protein PilW
LNLPSNPSFSRQGSFNQGFSLIELIIALTLGLVISGAVIQIMISNSVTDKLNRAIASTQESGRFIVARLRQDLLTAGRYDTLDPSLDRSVDTLLESAFVQSRPVLLANDFSEDTTVGSLEGAAGASDTLVIGMQALRDCRGYKLGYAEEQEFYVVNQYFLDGTSLKCRGFDGRYLRGLKSATGHNNHAAFTLLDDVISFQVMYGIARHDLNGDTSARPSRYVTADQLADEYAAGAQVVSIRIALLIMGDGEVLIEPVPSFVLLDETPLTPSQKRLYKQFETTVTLRNSKNHMRSNKG